MITIITKYLLPKNPPFYLIFMLFIVAPGLLYAAPITQIFVLHSYSQEYPWTQGQHEGFIQTLSNDQQVNASVTTEYLDTKRHTYNEAYTSEVARHFELKYKGYKPASIYVTDDNALLFARDHLSRIFPNTPVFFSGVNDYGIQSSLKPSFFTGVFERKEVAPNIEWLLSLDKSANDLIFIGDGSNTYQAIERQARKDLIPYRLRATFIAEKKLDRALARLQDLPGKYLFLTTLGGMIDADGQVLPLHDILKSLVLTGRIVISMEDAYIIEGVLGGSVTSGRKQGMSAAQLLLAYAHGKPIADLPPIFESPNALIFDDQALQQFSINLPKSLRKKAVLLNPRQGFYERHRFLILASLFGLASLLFLVVLGALVVLARKNRQLNLARDREKTANALFSHLAEQSRTVHWAVNTEGMYTHISPASYTVLGYHPEELVNKKHFCDLFPIEKRNAGKAATFDLFAKKEPIHGLEKKTQTKDGRQIWVLMSAVPVLDERGGCLGYRGSDIDITERKQAEDRANRFNRILESSLNEIFIFDAETLRFIEVNRGARENLGYSIEELRTLTPLDLKPEFTAESFAKLVDPLRTKAVESIQFNTVHRRKNGTQYPVEIHLQLVTDGTPLFVAIIIDITERKRDEEEKRSLTERLQRAEKMEALGTLAGGVAHDLNNVLGIVSGYSEMLLEDVSENSPLRSGLTNIMDGGQRAAAIVQDLLTLARRGVPSRSVLNLNQIIMANLKLPEFEKLVSYHPNIQIKTNLEPDLLNIAGSSVHIGKSIFNLVSNAAEAMKNGGTITIKTSNQYLDKPIHGYDDVEEGDYVVLSVSDTGEGISPADLKRIFEPFYTKKVMGRSGTGLGLAVVWGTAKDHSGYINVQSEEDEGSTFILYLPVTREELTVEAASMDTSEYMGKGESILVVDDVKGQRDLATTMLRKLNYNVKSVSSGEEALAYLQSNSVDLMVLDMIMDPGIDGLDTYTGAIKIHPKQKAIIVSGFSESDRVNAAQTLGAGAYVRKPYILEKLGLAVKKELEKV